MAPRLVNTRVWVETVKIPNKDIVKYLVVIDWHHDQLNEVVKGRPSEKFNTFVIKTLQDYIDKKKMPSEAILPAIMNLAEDHLSGRELTLRAGDYISLQQEFRAKGL